MGHVFEELVDIGVADGDDVGDAVTLEEQVGQAAVGDECGGMDEGEVVGIDGL